MASTDKTTRNGNSLPLVTLVCSPAVVVAVALPVVIWVTFACCLDRVVLADLFSARTFQIHLSILVLVLLAHAGASLRRRSIAGALIYGGLLLLLAQGLIWYGFRFSGVAGAGSGDQIVDYHQQERGAWAGDTRIPARVEAISIKEQPSVVFSLGEKRFTVPLHGSFNWEGYRVSPVAIESAPLMTLEKGPGEQIEALYIKMGAAPPERDFFLVKTLPHRIYIAPDGDRGLRIRIIRDKIEIVSTTVVWAEKLPYEGHYISFYRGEPWVRLAVEKKVSFFSAYAGGGMLLAGLLILLSRKRANGC